VPVFVLEVHASEVHAVLGGLLDRIRVADLRLAAISARAEAGNYKIRAVIDVGDCDVVDKLARRIGALANVTALDVRREHPCPTQASLAAAP
jgi:hypothetical protein